MTIGVCQCGKPSHYPNGWCGECVYVRRKTPEEREAHQRAKAAEASAPMSPRGARARKTKAAPKLSTQSETEIQTAILAAVKAYCPDVKLMRNAQVSRGRARGGLGTGSSDLIGVLKTVPERQPVVRLLGRFIALEVKREGEEADPHQETWLDDVRALGGFGAVVHSVSETFAAIERARDGGMQ